MSVNYSVNLARRNLVLTELQSMFASLAAATVTPNDVEKVSIGRRNLSKVPKFNLRTKSDPLELAAVVQDTSWYPMNGKWCYHPATVTSGSNFDASNQPTVEIRGAVHMVGAGTAPRPTHACIGKSTDGATWLHVSGTERPFGHGKGVALAMYANRSQPHYMGAGPGYNPINYPYDGRVTLYGMMGGSDGLADPTVYKYWTIMLNGTLADACQGFAWLTLNARDTGL